MNKKNVGYTTCGGYSPAMRHVIIDAVLTAAAVVATAATPPAQCPTYCTCTTLGMSGTSAVCTRFASFEQKFPYVVQHLTLRSEDAARTRTPLALGDDAFRRLGLPKLETLKIVDTALNVTERTFAGLASLFDIDLADNQLFLLHPDTFAENANLRRLNLSGNPMQLTQLLQPSQPYLLRSASLSDLDVSRCRLGKISSTTFSRLPNLNTLNLSSNTLKTLPVDSFVGLPYVETLDLSDNWIGRLENGTFRTNEQLTVLRLDGNPMETLDGVYAASLDRLDANRCRLSVLTRETVRGIPRATVLNLAANRIGAISDDTFTALPQLRKLVLSDNELAGPLPSDLFRANEKLEWLALSGNRGLGAFVDEAKGLTERHPTLSTLELADCGLRNLNGTIFKGLENLNVLNVSRNAIRRLDESTFVALKRLYKLDLSYNRLEAFGERLFAGNAELETLDVSGNPLKCLRASTFSRTPYLRYLWASRCELERVWAVGGGGGGGGGDVLTKLVHMDLSYNELKTLNGNDFDGMQRLEALNVVGNPLQCVKELVDAVALLNAKHIYPYRQHEYDTRIEWNEMLERICTANRRNESTKRKEEEEEVATKNEIAVNGVGAVRTSYTKLDEIVLGGADSGTAFWPTIMAVTILLVALYFIVFMAGEIMRRRKTAVYPYARSGLGGHVKSRDTSGSPLYYKLYEECSIPNHKKKKTYVLDLSPIHTILKKNAIYKAMNNDEVHV